MSTHSPTQPEAISKPWRRRGPELMGHWRLEFKQPANLCLLDVGNSLGPPAAPAATSLAMRLCPSVSLCARARVCVWAAFFLSFCGIPAREDVWLAKINWTDGGRSGPCEDDMPNRTNLVSCIEVVWDLRRRRVVHSCMWWGWQSARGAGKRRDCTGARLRSWAPF